MAWLSDIDHSLSVWVTQLGGDSLTRDGIVYFLAEWFPYVSVAILAYIFFQGRTPAQQRRNQDVVIVTLLALLLALGLRILIADAVARPRPFLAHPEIHSINLGTLARNPTTAFPSLHSLLLFTVAGGVLFQRKHQKLAITLLLVASVVAAARVVAGVHYIGDVIGGALLGLAIAWIVVWQRKIVIRPLR